MSNSSFQKLFNRRPASATVGLSIAAISFVFTLILGVSTLLTSAPSFFFDFVVRTASTNGADLTFRQAIIGCVWALLGLLACYRALDPSNLARFSVIAISGVKFLALLGTFQKAWFTAWDNYLLLTVAIAPIVLLLLRPSNQYYGRNQ